MTSCDAVAPTRAVKIGGVDLPINPRDLVYRDFVDPVTGLCMTAIAGGGAGPFILGAAFMQNVLSIFDVGNQEMPFLSRAYY